MGSSENDLDSLISHTVALGWGNLEGVIAEDGKDPEVATGLVLVGQIITNRPLNKVGIRMTIFKSWHFVVGLEIEELEDNCFLFTFPSPTALTKVLDQSPWNVKGHMLVLSDVRQEPLSLIYNYGKLLCGYKSMDFPSEVLLFSWPQLLELRLVKLWWLIFK